MKQLWHYFSSILFFVFFSSWTANHSQFYTGVVQLAIGNLNLYFYISSTIVITNIGLEYDYFRVVNKKLDCLPQKYTTLIGN